MKKSLDVKSFVTIAFTISLIALLFIAIFKSETIFEMVFLLFTNLCTAVFTYFFTKKKESDTNVITADKLQNNEQVSELLEKTESYTKE